MNHWICLRRHAMLFLPLFLLMSNSCRRQEPVKAEPQPARKYPDQEGWNSKVTSTINGRIEAIVHYGHMARFNESRLALFDEGVRVEFFDEHGLPRSVLTAERGELREASNDISAFGGVKVVSDTLTLWTEELHYEQRTEKIRSDVEVKFVTLSGDTLFGNGFESDARLRHYHIRNLHGLAHRRVDLSLDRFRKPASPDSQRAQQP
ncbi:LPS export ABC transporter periplasmic protein LptC [bacterium]|nr:LPS export ABC transporter periplasmic protein LptC [bacterium]